MNIYKGIFGVKKLLFSSESKVKNTFKEKKKHASVKHSSN